MAAVVVASSAKLLELFFKSSLSHIKIAGNFEVDENLLGARLPQSATGSW